jgi:hypothetical protein
LSCHCRLSRPAGAVFGDDGEPPFQPGEEAFDLRLLALVEVDHLLGQEGEQVVDDVSFRRYCRGACRLKGQHAGVRPRESSDK